MSHSLSEVIMQKAFSKSPMVGDTVIFTGPLPECKELTGKVVSPGIVSMWVRVTTGEDKFQDYCVTPRNLVRVKESVNG